MSLRREKHVHSFLGKGLVACTWRSHLNNMELGKRGGNKVCDSKKRALPHLSPLLGPHGKGEQCGFLCVSRHFELAESSSMALNGLADLTLHRVELHVTCNSVLLG